MPPLSDVETRLRGCFEVVFPNVPPDVLGTASVETLDGWDSIATVTLVGVIEDEFGVDFSDEGIECAVSFQSLLAYVGESAAQG